MTARVVSTLAAALLAAALSASALAGATARDARTLVLRKSDFPAGARAVLREENRQSSIVTFRYRVSGRSNDLSSWATVFASRKAATAGFRELKSDFGQRVPTLPLPKGYGNEQHVSLQLGEAQLIVRKNTVVWVLHLTRTGSTGSNRNEIKSAEATAELAKYAAVVKGRVGSGL